MPEPAARDDRLAHLTDAQRQAVLTVDRSVLVSAAAGSGKTTVLAERCAALVCDAPTDQRCRINELLVVTFTDAAASTMRSRIADAIRHRLASRRDDLWLTEQLYLLDSASISTIHSFCRTLIQRWFPQAGVDPQAAVLAADEAELLRREVLDALFAELYAGDDELGVSFQRLVDDYGAGDDTAIADILLRLHAYLASLPAPQAWLERAANRLDPQAPDSLIARLDALQHERLCEELSLQIEYARHLSDTVRRSWPAAASRADEISEHVDQLEQWQRRLAAGGPESWESVAAEIGEFEPAPARRRSPKLSDEEKDAFDQAKERLDQAKKLFATRLKDQVCAFTADEYREGLTCVAPYVRTLAALVSEFERRYRDAKTAQAAVDFNDLQRCALGVLTERDDPRRPSEVARQLQRQYRHVLVDEFQDIDPLQEAILRLVSRECAEPPAGNLFAVGDIKQSIYRFRLAEPMLFTARADAFTQRPAVGQLIHLQDNFRSRGHVIDAINLVFAPLMDRAFGGSDYDDTARLHAGATFPDRPNPRHPADAASALVFDTPAVELHLIEPVTEQTRVDQDEDQDAPDGQSDELEGIERESYLIARRIQQWMGDNRDGVRWHVTDKPDAPGELPRTRPIEYRDIVILLRSMPHKAGPIADVLRRMNVPVRVERHDAGLDSTEFRDVISLLHLLDNPQQDIPLAALLRSPLLGEPFSETALLEARLFDRDLPFHAAVERYARQGPDQTLRDRLALVFATLDRYRRDIRRTPAAEVLWRIFEESSYLGYVSGLPDGVRRGERLVRLHELARQFGRFNRQGLHRFLRFVEQMLERDRSPVQPSTGGAGDNVVRIMTIHTSKGLEFPVVILADLSKRFNLADLKGTVLLDRELGIAMRAADAERRILYPTLIHQLAARQGRREALSEELRVLYVALTRAREHLVLVGRAQPPRGADGGSASAPHAGRDARLPRLQLEAASSPLDWLLPALTAAPDGAVQWHLEGTNQAAALFEVSTHDRATTDQWRIPPAMDPQRTDALARFADLSPLPAEEPLAPPDEMERVIEAISAEYSGLELTTLPARVAVSDLKRRWDATPDPDERLTLTPRRVLAPARPAFAVSGPTDDPLQRGSATHRFLQLVDLARPCDAADLKQQCRELIESGRLLPGDAGAVMIEAAAWFFGTELGQRMRQRAADVHREVAFVSRIAPQQYDPLVRPRDDRDVLLVRGIVDALIRGPSRIEIVEYKTDAVRADACEARAQQYRPQIDTYTTAVQAIYRCPVSQRSLVFLHARRIVELAGSAD